MKVSWMIDEKKELKVEEEKLNEGKDGKKNLVKFCGGWFLEHGEV